MTKKEPLGIQETLDARRTKSTFRVLTTSPRDAVDFSSNDFLSLASNTALRKAFLKELQDQRIATQLGSGGSRLLDGNSSYAEDLEKDIASFHNASSGLLCNSGFDANVSVFSCLPQPHDIVIFDELIHASAHDGMKLSRAALCVPFAHNDPNALQTKLSVIRGSNPGVRYGRVNVWVCVEAVYSMDGDVAPLKEISALLESILPLGNGHLVVDEAHATGLFGREGRGLVCQLGLEDKVTVRLHTFGKALACGGAILLCSLTVRDYLINYARPLIYTTFMIYPSLAAIKVSYDFLRGGAVESLIARLNHLSAFLHSSLLGLEMTLGHQSHEVPLLQVPKAPSLSAISYVMSPRPKALAAHCRKLGFVVRAIVPPTVHAGTERIRICLHADNTYEQISGLVRAIKVWAIEERAKHCSSRTSSNL